MNKDKINVEEFAVLLHKVADNTLREIDNLISKEKDGYCMVNIKAIQG